MLLQEEAGQPQTPTQTSAIPLSRRTHASGKPGIGEPMGSEGLLC